MNYKTLLNKIKVQLDIIEQNVESFDQRAASIRAAWDIGNEAYHYKQETGALSKSIAEDVGLSDTSLDRYIRFYRNYPTEPSSTINGKPVLLSHYLTLVYLSDPKERDFYLSSAAEQGWSSHELRRRLRNNFYESYCQSLTAKTNRGIKLSKILKVIPQHLYTYSATVLRVVDGDTLILDIDVGFRLRTEQKVRLRGINCAEKGTKRGEKAAEFVRKQLFGGNGKLQTQGSSEMAQSKKQSAMRHERCLPAGQGSVVTLPPLVTSHLPTVIVRTYKSEKFGRYLVDIWYLSDEIDPEKILANGRWLNQELLDNNLAVKVE